jgi:hypothetical protein
VQELAALDVQLIVTTWFTSAFATSALISTVGAALVTVVELPEPPAPPPQADKIRKAKNEERGARLLCICHLQFIDKSYLFIICFLSYLNFETTISRVILNAR